MTVSICIEQVFDLGSGAQLSYLHTLAQDVGREVPENVTKAQASELIDELRQKSERVEE